jgi:hypothetical protein
MHVSSYAPALLGDFSHSHFERLDAVPAPRRPSYLNESACANAPNSRITGTRTGYEYLGL